MYYALGLGRQPGKRVADMYVPSLLVGAGSALILPPDKAQVWPKAPLPEFSSRFFAAAKNRTLPAELRQPQRKLDLLIPIPSGLWPDIHENTISRHFGWISVPVSGRLGHFCCRISRENAFDGIPDGYPAKRYGRQCERGWESSAQGLPILPRLPACRLVAFPAFVCLDAASHPKTVKTPRITEGLWPHLCLVG